MVKRSSRAAKNGSRGNAPCRDSVPAGVWGNAPTVSLATNSKEAASKGAGSEASLPVPSRVLRRASKLLYPPLAHCRARWARPSCCSFQHSISFSIRRDFAPAGATRGQRKQTKSAIAPLTPSAPQLLGLSAACSCCCRGISPLRRRGGGFPVAPSTPSAPCCFGVIAAEPMASPLFDNVFIHSVSPEIGFLLHSWSFIFYHRKKVFR